MRIIGYPLRRFSDFPGGSNGKASVYNAGDPGLIPGLGRSPGEGSGTPLQYSCLENPMDGGTWKAAVHGVAEGWTQLSDFIFTFHSHALEKEMATHSSVLAWRIPGTGEPGGLPSMGSHRVGHDWSNLAVAAKCTLWGIQLWESWEMHTVMPPPPQDTEQQQKNSLVPEVQTFSYSFFWPPLVCFLSLQFCLILNVTKDRL